MKHTSNVRDRRAASKILVLILGFVSVFATAPLLAQVTITEAKPGPPMMPPVPPIPAAADGSTFPRTPDGHPDLSGIWFAGIKDFVSYNDAQIDVPLTPEYAAIRRKWITAIAAGRPFADSVSKCEAFGVPRVMSFNLFEFISSPAQLTFISEDLHEVRRIYTDGRGHPDNLDASFDGHSVGHWEGDTLVVDTVGLTGNATSASGILHSDQMRVLEKITMVNENGLKNEITMTDPKSLTKPWTVTLYYRRMPSGTELKEYDCVNNRNLPDAAGRTTAR